MSATIATSIRNPITEGTTRNAISTPAAMAHFDQRIRRFLSRKEAEQDPVSDND
jgi:hypothetical protein